MKAQHLKRFAYCYLVGALAQILVFLNLDSNKAFFHGDHVFGGWMTIVQIAILPIMPIGHFVVFCMSLINGEQSPSGILTLVFFVAFATCWAAAKFIFETKEASENSSDSKHLVAKD